MAVSIIEPTQWDMRAWGIPSRNSTVLIVAGVFARFAIFTWAKVLYFPRGPERKSRPPFVIAFPSLFPTFVFVKFVPQVHPYMIFPVVQYLCLHYSSSYSKPLFFSWNRSYPFLDFVVRRQCNFTSILPPSVCNLPILFVFRFHFLIVHLSFDWGVFFPKVLP